MTIRVGVDVGGTFTDFAVFDDALGRVSRFKVASTPAPADAVVEGFSQLIASGVEPRSIGQFVHGTTVVLNTLLQRSGARVGLVTTRGFRDVLALRRLRLEGAPSLDIRRPEPLVPRRDIKEVEGRLRADGSEIRPLDESEIARAATELVTAGCETIAICFLHSYRNNAHEKRAADTIHTVLPQVSVTTASDLWPQQREYERTELAVINAHVTPVMRNYHDALRSALKSMGVSAGILSTKSNGGVMSADRVKSSPVETVLSGPASGVVAAAHLGTVTGYGDMVALDMGGTSADAGLVLSGVASTTTEATVGDFPVIMPSVDVSSIGAGGGSIAAVDAEGVLKVGPASAGSVPGPACYGRGGDACTITDAYAVLGLVSGLLGGTVALDLEAAREVCAAVGEPLGMGPFEAAEAICDVATANMYARLLPMMAQRGADPREFSLLAYGGAGPVHAFRIAGELGFKRVLIPPSPGTFCALGCLLADLRADFVASVYTDIDRMAENELAEVFGTLKTRAWDWVRAEGMSLSQATLALSADMRHSGQSYDIPVSFTAELSAGFRQQLREAFFASYQRIYGDPDRSGNVEIVNARAQVIVTTDKPILHPPPTDRTQLAATTRSVRHRGQELEACVYQRSSLSPGDRISGTAIVASYDSTTLVPPEAFVEVDSFGNLVGGVVGV